ncbi:MAG TPA: hypothetical protein VN238_16550 [Solirubrobacteraceae bacterium]|nr:hypothetical protein [Solirubrobacteraceae bacterium]
MTSKRIALTAASVLALSVAATPAAADAAADQNKLMGSPSLRVLNANEIGVQIPLDLRVPRKNGRVQLTMTLSGKKVGHIGFSGTHGSDFLYAGSLSDAGFVVDRKYTLKIKVPGQAAIVRKVTLRERS